MIPRYDESTISNLWTETAKFEKFLAVELAIISALEGSKAPKGTAESIRTKAKINVSRIDEIERETRHDVIAFCTSITEQLTPDEARFFHYGVTSSDIIDTALSLQIKDSLVAIIEVYEKTLHALYDKALEHKKTICMGRSHGMFAEPMSFGQKLLGHYCELKRRLDDLKSFLNTELTGQFSGAVGNYAVLTPLQEEMAVKSLGLSIENVSTQVIPRDRIAKLISIGALIGSAIERLAVEIRHLHHSDIGELHEGFSKGQKGSSTMPHKKNPISGENLSGLARVLRSHFQIAADNIVLWHERDISHSSAERLYLPDHFGVLYYSLKRLGSTVENLVINRKHMEEKVWGNTTYLSSYYLHKLLDLTELRREELYPIVQKASFESAKTNDPQLFHRSIMDELGVRSIKIDLRTPSKDEITDIYLGSVEQVFTRV